MPPTGQIVSIGAGEGRGEGVLTSMGDLCGDFEEDMIEDITGGRRHDGRPGRGLVWGRTDGSSRGGMGWLRAGVVECRCSKLDP